MHHPTRHSLAAHTTTVAASPLHHPSTGITPPALGRRQASPAAPRALSQRTEGHRAATRRPPRLLHRFCLGALAVAWCCLAEDVRFPFRVMGGVRVAEALAAPAGRGPGIRRRVIRP